MVLHQRVGEREESVGGVGRGGSVTPPGLSSVWEGATQASGMGEEPSLYHSTQVASLTPRPLAMWRHL